MKINFVVMIVLTTTFAAAGVSCVESSLPRYEIIDLGTLGGKSSSADAINDAGQLIGESYTTSGSEHAFFWDPESGMIDLGTFGGDESCTSAINSAGQVVGSSETASGDGHAFIWDSKNGMIDLGTLGGRTSGAFAINNAGQVAGWSRYSIDSDDFHAFLWDSASGMIDLGTLGGSRSWASGINDAGQVVGGSETGKTTIWSGRVRNVEHIFLWDSNDGMTDLGYRGDIIGITGFNNTGQVAGWSRNEKFRAFLWDSTNGFRDIGTLGGNHSRACGINDAGQVIGESNKTADVESYYAFLWDSTSGMTEIGRLGDLFSWALGSRARPHAINNTGQVVGWSARGHEFFGQGHAFYWDRNNGMIKLSKLLRSKSGWKRLIIAEDINNRGQIVGYGETASGENHAFLMTPVPEPVGE
jgi:probable HAF family extracellular repeat protein